MLRHLHACRRQRSLAQCKEATASKSHARATFNCISTRTALAFPSAAPRVSGGAASRRLYHYAKRASAQLARAPTLCHATARYAIFALGEYAEISSTLISLRCGFRRVERPGLALLLLLLDFRLSVIVTRFTAQERATIHAQVRKFL